MHASCVAFILVQALALCLCAMPDSQYNLFFNLPLPSRPNVVAVGQMLVLNCEAGGSPTPTIHWLHNGRRILQGDERHSKNAAWQTTVENASNKNVETLQLGSTRSRLFIDCITPADQGKYTCVASANDHTITSTATLQAGAPEGGQRETPFVCLLQKRGHLRASPARVYMWTSQRLEFEGGDVQLFCRGDGKPAPKITWYDQEGNVISDGSHYKQLENGDLFIHRVSFLDNMGVYTCVAENLYGKDLVETFLYPTSP